MWPFKKREIKRELPRAPVIRIAPTMKKRTFSGATMDNLTFSFQGTGLSANAELIRSLPMLRRRSRQLYMDNDYVKKFLNMVKGNVIGPNGIRLQARSRSQDGTLDRADNEVIERAWKEWGQAKNCSVTKRLSWLDVQRLFVETIARDGEALLTMHQNFNNDFGFAVRVIECDYLDTNYNKALDNGNEIIMGVEVNKWKEPVAYHVTTAHPGQYSYEYAGTKYDRIDAGQVIHGFICERPEQLRGVPWLHTAIRRLDMLGGYEEAELVAARVGASKMGFFKNTAADQYTGDDVRDSDGNLITEVSPGTFENIGDQDFVTFDPQHPTSAYDSYISKLLRGISSGLNVAYEGLSNDRAGVNYSSIRSGVIDERDQWRSLQGWTVENLHARVFEKWLDYCMLTKKIDLPMRKIDKFHEVVWQARGWQWVDPLKDSKASEQSIALGVETRTDVAAARGKDLREVFETLRAEEQLAQEMGITLAPLQASETISETDTDEREND